MGFPFAAMFALFYALCSLIQRHTGVQPLSDRYNSSQMLHAIPCELRPPAGRRQKPLRNVEPHGPLLNLHHRALTQYRVCGLDEVAESKRGQVFVILESRHLMILLDTLLTSTKFGLRQFKSSPRS